jgi:uncharacterized protein (TIGR02145 family)
MGLCGLLALAFVSCKKDKETTGNMTFEATISQPTSNSKTHIGPDNMLVWDAGNTIKVFNAAGQYGDFTTNDNNAVTATFAGTLTASESYTAFYPNAQFDGTNVRVAVGGTQTYVADNFANNSYPMLATNSGDNFLFHSHAGVLRLQFTSEVGATVGSITVAGVGNDVLAGTMVYPYGYHYDFNDVMPYTVEGGVQEVTLNCGTGVTLQSTPTVFNIILLENALSNGFTVTLKAVDGSELQSFTAPEGNTIMAENIVIMPELAVTGTGGGGGDEHAYVDLGLPSGLLWATCNVGADTPEDYGDYFAWGETQPKSVYNYDTYQYYDGNNLTKYTGSDGLATLLPEDDAATANWGNGWRMPTQTEWQELLDNTTSTLTTQNGVYGRLFTASNGNSIFLPAAGWRRNSSLDYAGSYGYYWSSSLSDDFQYDAWHFFLYDYSVGSNPRYLGLTVRPVCSSRQN